MRTLQSAGDRDTAIVSTTLDLRSSLLCAKYAAIGDCSTNPYTQSSCNPGVDESKSELRFGIYRNYGSSSTGVSRDGGQAISSYRVIFLVEPRELESDNRDFLNMCFVKTP